LTSIVQLIGGRYANLLLFAVTLVELNVLIWTTTTFAVEDWIYLSQHILVLAIAVTRRRPVVQDRSWSAALAVAVSYAYPYAQVFYLNSTDGYVAWPAGGVTLVIFSALLSLSALLSIGRLFGVRPALRGITRNGPYRLVRHPMYLAYFIADIGYLLEEWNIGAVLIAAAGWVSLVYRIYAEERMLSRHSDWAAYVARTRYRLVPGLW
jgi:protein-S-isoprenylcysteine O-methyltransferase Ste14